MSQEKFGDALGVTFQQVQKYEKGTNRISASRLQAAATVLDVGVDYFFEGLSGPTAPQALTSLDQMTSILRTPDGVALVLAFNRLKSRDLRKKVRVLVEEIVGLK
jgi:transcriptional regulator with XRE-family HTH domain